MGSLKSKASTRDLPLPVSLLDRMKTLRGEPSAEESGQPPSDTSKTSDWVFGSRNGTPLNAGNVRKRFLYPAAKAVGIELTGWHDLRHSATTNMIRDGVSINTVSKLMGHSNPNITLAVYDHPNFQDFRAPLKEMSAQLL